MSIATSELLGSKKYTFINEKILNQEEPTSADKIGKPSTHKALRSIEALVQFNKQQLGVYEIYYFKTAPSALNTIDILGALMASIISFESLLSSA
ncbi:MAG: hypothetical protein RJA07_2536 [Bacteroidota bacterium]